jgi:hypothetical protein
MLLVLYIAVGCYQFYVDSAFRLVSLLFASLIYDLNLILFILKCLLIIQMILIFIQPVINLWFKLMIYLQFGYKIFKNRLVFNKEFEMIWYFKF